MHNSKLKRISVALCMALVPISVLAAGLGKLNVMSGLGEPLKADIELLSVTAEELSSISAAIASEEAYAIQGIEKPASHNTIKVDIGKSGAGVPILKLKSSQPISEPFLDMLIQVDWASGRLLREYTVLLDPPGYTGEADASTQAVQAPLVKSFSKNKKANPANIMADDNIPADVMPADEPLSQNKRVKKTKPAQDVEVAGDSAGDDYVTRRGDTLAKIAQDMKPDGVSLEQMLVGLYQTNPNAFQGDNINRLKVGQILRQPSQATLSAISRAEAVSEIKVQTANWNAYRNKLAGIVADAAPNDTEASAQSAGGKITSAQDKSEVLTSGPKDVVKLSTGEPATKASADNVKSLQDKISALQEEATAREKSVKEAQDRTTDLEKQIAELQKLLAMKNGAMAEIQKQAEMTAPAEIAPVPPVESEKPAEPINPAEPTPVEAVAPVESNPKPVITPTEVTPIEETSFFAGILDNLNINLLAPLGGLLALLGGGWLYLRKKREKNLADFEQGIMTSGGLKANTVFGNTASASVDTGDTSFLTDFSQSANGGMIDTNDVDPIAEAEVYMAYGRDAQAEEILKDAISKEPKRHELHLKLLEMYAASKNLSAFETIAGELYTSLGAEDPMWTKVAEIGIKLEPNNPLYQANSTPTGVGDGLDASDFANTPLAAEKDLDFSFDNESLVQNFETQATKAEPSVEEAAFDLPQFDAEPNAETRAAETPEVEAVTNDALDFDMGDFGDFESKQADALVEKSATTDDVDEANFGNTMPALDLPSFDAPKFMPDALSVDDATEITLDANNIAPDTSETQTKLNELDIASIDFPQLDTLEADFDDNAVLDISGMESDLNAADFKSSTDFNFDVPTISPESADVSNDNKLEANVFDLNTINLDLNDDTSSTIDSAVPEYSIESDVEAPADFNISGSEPIEVETKLDLVAAYIEMDDKEGAKELLDEVMKEGGAGQRKRAEALMAQLT